jgi:putative tricarboxylic transport membrane protein
MIACVYEIAKNLFSGKRDGEIEGVLGSVLKEMPAESEVPAEDEPKYPRLLWAGIAATILYVPLIEVLGFFLCTAIYLAVFTWLGRYRRLPIVIATSVIGSLVFMFVFMKIVYVSLPLGTEPFAQVSFLLMRLMGIK